MAVSLLSVSLVAILGLLSATTRSATDVADAQGLASLGASILGEVERLKVPAGFAGLAALVPADGSAVPLRLVGTRDGRRVLIAGGVDPAANHPLDDPALPGIANRDRFFLVEFTRLAKPDVGTDAGYIAVGARCSWPYQIPTGPPTPGATDCDADPAREVPANERRVALINFAVRP